jgi:hypothetical protein
MSNSKLSYLSFSCKRNGTIYNLYKCECGNNLKRKKCHGYECKMWQSLGLPVFAIGDQTKEF